MESYFDARGSNRGKSLVLISVNIESWHLLLHIGNYTLEIKCNGNRVFKELL